MKNVFRSSPSKFGKGTGLLWRGIDKDLIKKFLLKKNYRYETYKNRKTEKLLKFESARTALFNCLDAHGVGDTDEVIVSSFTCDAVTFGVKRTRASIVYVDIKNDLTMNDQDVLNAIGPRTKAIIFQNTLGRLGLKRATIDEIKSRGIFLIEDCVLSIGSKIDNILLGSFGDVSFFSLEVSKTITIGWGGLVRINNKNYEKKILARYFSTGRISFLGDIRRFFQLWLSVHLTNIQSGLGVYLWVFLYSTRIFRRSATYKFPKHNNHDKLGVIGEKLFLHIHPEFDKMFKKTSENYRVLLNEAHKCNLVCPIEETLNELVVTPRIPILVHQKNMSEIIKMSEELGVEIGRWFNVAPPSWELASCKIHSNENALRISQEIINLPCYWTLSSQEIDNVKKIMRIISTIQKKSWK